MKKTILFIAVLVALTACTTRIIQEPPGGQQQNAIIVQGNSEFDVAPDLAKIRFGIRTNSSNAQEAQQKNREVANAVTAALMAAGVAKDEIETTDYRIERLQEWDYKLQTTVDRGYQVSNTFVVSTKNLEKVGTLLDVGVQAGANNVESLSFELSDQKQREVKTEALRKATMNAREKAEALADGAGVRLGKVLTLSENSYVVLPYTRYDVMAKAEGGPAMPPTPISPQNVQITAQVSVSYEIG